MKRATVLVMDDDAAMRTWLVRVLRCLPDTGLELIKAANGVEALAVMAGVPVDLVLLNRFVPVLDGIQFLRQARAAQQYQSLPIMMISSEGAGAQVQAALDAGATSFLVKRPSSEALRGTVLEPLENTRA